MEMREKQFLQLLANILRGLALDAIEEANSGHPGLPLGSAEILAYLYGKTLRHTPENPNWPGRDRFVLSAGHGSALLYAALHLSGYLSLADLRNFRQLHSLTPGHPEYSRTPGGETTTGPLGQGLANAVGMALANKMVTASLGIENENLLTGQIFVLAGDGCLMEGVTQEAASLAGHLQLDNLIVIYDSNEVCLDGSTSECLTDDTRGKFQAFHWYVTEIDGHSLNQIEDAITTARVHQGQPSLIIAKTIIGKGSSKQGTSSVHGAPLGKEEVERTKRNLGISLEPFWVPPEIKNAMAAHQAQLAVQERQWQERFKTWQTANPEKADVWKFYTEKTLPPDLEEQLWQMKIAPNQASRQASGIILQKIHQLLPFVIGGSADLSSSDKTILKASGIVSASDFGQTNIKFGVREHAMAAIISGMALSGLLLPYCGTFLVFSDYMRPAIRLAALMKLRVIYVFTHDSIFVGEDGPTHQPIEQLASLRAIPGLTVIRPADTNEVRAAWSWILRQAQGPVALILSRQSLPDLSETNIPTNQGVGCGGYVIRKETNPGAIDHCLIATGSEVQLALKLAGQLTADGQSIRVVSLPSWEIFDSQEQGYRDSVLGGNIEQHWSIEAGRETGWHKYIGRQGRAICLTTFGQSAPAKDLARYFGFTVEQILKRIQQTEA